MKYFIRRITPLLWLSVVFFLFWMSPTTLAHDLDYLPLEEVTRGMTGYGRSVFYGTAIESFDIQVVDIVEMQRTEESYFVIRVIDEQVRRLGGISAGMSGSPIYLKGKIAGALSYSWETRDNLIGIVTPIEAMVKLWDRPVNLAFVQPQSHILMLGIEGRGQEMIRRDSSLQRLFALPRLFPARGTDQQTGELEPGSAVGIQLIKGDVDIVSIGTLTALSGDRFLAFGHPFLHRGPANYFLSSMFVNFSVEGKEFPFKVGSPIEPIGIVDEDRTAGVSGRLNIYPLITRCRLMVEKENDGTARVFHFDVVRDEAVIVEFLPGVILDSIDRVMDSQVPGSARVNIEISAGNQHFLQEYFWVSQYDIASLTTNHLGKILEIFFLNPFVPVQSENIDIQVVITPEIREAIFLSLSLPSDVKRGEILEGTVDIHLHRRGIKSIDFSISVPADFVLGETEVVLRGLPSGIVAVGSPTDLETYLEDRANEIKTNGFMVELLSKSDIFPLEGARTFYSQRVSLPFVLDGTYSGTLVIKD